jgi:hypothetical protein
MQARLGLEQIAGIAPIRGHVAVPQQISASAARADNKPKRPKKLKKHQTKAKSPGPRPGAFAIAVVWPRAAQNREKIGPENL